MPETHALTVRKPLLSTMLRMRGLYFDVPDKGGEGRGSERPRRSTGGALAQLNEQLREDNFQLREKKRSLEGEIAELKKKIPGDGATVLTGDDAKAWTGFQALKLSPAQITTALTERDTLQAKVAEAERKTLIDQAAEAAGYVPRVLRDQVERLGLHIELREVKRETDGKEETIKVPHVRPAKDEKAPLEALDTFAERELKDYLPILRAETATDRGGSQGRSGSGASYPVQRPNGGAARTEVSDKDLAAAAAATGEYTL